MRQILSRLSRLYTLVFRWAAWQLNQLVLSIYTSPRPALRKLLAPVQGLQLCFEFLLKGWFFRYTIFEGVRANCSQNIPMKAACFGSKSGLDFFEQLLFRPGAARSRPGFCFFWQFPSIAARLAREVDLVVVERVRLGQWRPPTGSWVRSPSRLTMVVDFQEGETWEERKEILKTRQSGNLKRIAREKFTFSIHRDEASLDFFFHRMYLPTVLNRHSYFPIIETLEEARRMYQDGFLVFCLNSAGQPVAGDLIQVKGDVFFATLTGVLDGSPEWTQRGAASALYLHGFIYSLEHRLRRYDTGPCFPFCRNGVYEYKQRWGFQPAEDAHYTQEWVFWVPGCSSAAKGWIEDHPLAPALAEYGGELLPRAEPPE